MRNPYSASQLGRRFLCPGSAKAEAGLPEIKTDEAASGTRIHAAAAVLDLREPGFEDVNEAAAAFDLTEDETDVLRDWIKFREATLP